MITHDELMETARELGIDPSQLEAAANDYATTAGLEAAREQWKTQRKKKFYEHLWSYIFVNGFLFAINAITGGFPWVIFPILGWGLGLAFDARDAFFPSDRKVERGAQHLLARRNREEIRDQMRQFGRNFRKGVTIDGKRGKIVIEKGDKRIEIG